MQDDKFDQQEQKLSGRRSRKDEQGRDYVCGCGKSYLSYPALYTHIKTKHDGQRPEGTCKVGIVGTRKVGGQSNSPNPTNNNAQNNNQGKNLSSTTPTKSLNNLKNAAHSPQTFKSRLNPILLQSLQDLTSFSDFRFASLFCGQESNETNFTMPDNRLKEQKVGIPIYQKYLELVKQGDGMASIVKESQSVSHEQIKIQKIGYKTEIQEVMVIFLLGAGRFIGEQLMEYYMDFCRLFRDCYIDHGEQIYEVAFKNNQHIEQKEHLRQRDNPYKYYQYSYAPSSSKSKSYQYYQTAQVNPGLGNIIINPNQCKYCPIICEFFIKVYVPLYKNEESFRQIMQLICADFCSWMYKGKMTVVDVTLIRKYQFKSIDSIVAKIGKQNSKKKQKMKIKENRRKKDEKKKNDSKANSGNSQEMDSSNMEDDLDGENNPHGLDESPNIDNSELHDNQDQDFYKLDELGHEIGVRDRSGSIQHYVNGHNQADHEGIEEHENQLIVQQNRVEVHVVQSSGRNNNINEEEIEQYINP